MKMRMEREGIEVDLIQPPLKRGKRPEGTT
jgi:hypothetical protein